MSKESQTAEAKSGAKGKTTVEPDVAAEQLADELAGLALVPGGPVAAGGSDTIEAQAARLGDPRFLTAQRHAMAAQIGQVGGNRHLQTVLSRTAPAYQIARLVEYNEDVEGGQYTDPELASGTLPFTEEGWDSREIGRRLTQLGDPRSTHDEVRCVQTSFLVALVQRGPGAVRGMIENYLRRYRVGLNRASTPPRIKRWYRRSLRNLRPLLAKIDGRTLTYEDLSTILREMYSVYGTRREGTYFPPEENMARREGYEVTRIGGAHLMEDAAEEAQALEPGEVLACGVEVSRRGTGEVGHRVHIGRRPDGSLYFYDPWPVRGDQMIECSEDLHEIEHYFYNPVEGEGGEEAEGEGGEETELEVRTFEIDFKLSPPAEEGEEAE